MYFDILCKYCSTSGITSYSIDFLIYKTLYTTSLIPTYLFHFLHLFRRLHLFLSPCAILILSYPHDHLVVDFGWQLSFDVHECLQEHLLSHEFELLLLVLILYQIYLLETVETLSRLEIHFLGQLKHQVVEVPHRFQWLA